MVFFYGVRLVVYLNIEDLGGLLLREAHLGGIAVLTRRTGAYLAPSLAGLFDGGALPLKRVDVRVAEGWARRLRNVWAEMLPGASAGQPVDDALSHRPKSEP